jgi:hypothetical protein
LRRPSSGMIGGGSRKIGALTTSGPFSPKLRCMTAKLCPDQR